MATESTHRVLRHSSIHSLVRLHRSQVSLLRIAHMCSCPALLASLAHSAALMHSFACSLANSRMWWRLLFMMRMRQLHTVSTHCVLSLSSSYSYSSSSPSSFSGSSSSSSETPEAHPGGAVDDEIHLELAPASNQSYAATLTTEQLFIVILAILASIAFLTGKWVTLTTRVYLSASASGT